MQTPFPAIKKTFNKQHGLKRDVISFVTTHAEKEPGYSPGKVGWLAWFGGIFRNNSELFQKFRYIAEDLPPLEREIFQLYFVDQLSLRDIVLIVGCTARTFNAHLRSIQHHLREALVQEVLTDAKLLVVDNWSLRLKCRSCGIGRENSILATDHA